MNPIFFRKVKIELRNIYVYSSKRQHFIRWVKLFFFHHCHIQYVTLRLYTTTLQDPQLPLWTHAHTFFAQVTFNRHHSIKYTPAKVSEHTHSHTLSTHPHTYEHTPADLWLYRSNVSENRTLIYTRVQCIV